MDETRAQWDQRHAEAERMAAEIDAILDEVATHPHTFAPDPDDPARCNYELPSGYECGGAAGEPEHAAGGEG